MKILFIAPRLPHPRVASGHMIVYQRIKRLASRGHEIGLVVFDSNGDRQHVPEIHPLLSELEIVPPPIPPTALRRLVHYVASSRPSYFSDFYSPEMMRRVGEMVERSRYDIALAEFSGMGQYLYRNPYLPAVRKIISCHYSITTIFRKTARVMRYRPGGIRSRLSLSRLMKYEYEMYRNVDRVLVLTAQERYALLNESPNLRISIIPAGVDTDMIRPAADDEKEDGILFTGDYHFHANRDAVMWFARTAWPLIKTRQPHLKFYVVGPGPTATMQEIAREDPDIVVTGEVSDIRTHLHKAKLFVCPVRLGSGLRLKILEAMAAGLPVVTTTLGAEGMPLQSGDNSLIADKPEMMAEYVNLLLDDQDLRASIARNARTLVENRFSWDHGISLLEHAMAEVTRQG